MKKSLILLVAFIAAVFSANAQYTFGTNSSSTYVNGYYRSNGTYVEGHYRTSRNSTNRDNYSTVGNSNPYTGVAGSRAQDYSIQSYNYGGGNTIYTGPRGGQYYYNSNGQKTYVPKRR